MTIRHLFTILLIAQLTLNCHAQSEPNIETYLRVYDDSLNSTEFFSKFTYSTSTGKSGKLIKVGTGIFAKRGLSFRHSLTFDKNTPGTGPLPRSFDVAGHSEFRLMHFPDDPALVSSVFRTTTPIVGKFQTGYASDEYITPIFPLGASNGHEFSFGDDREWLKEGTIKVDGKQATVYLENRLNRDIYNRRITFDLNFDPPALTSVRREYRRVGDPDPVATEAATLSDFVKCDGGMIAKTVVMDRSVDGYRKKDECILTVIRKVADADFDVTFPPNEIISGLRGLPMGKKRVLNLAKINQEQLLKPGDPIHLVDTVGKLKIDLDSSESAKGNRNVLAIISAVATLLFAIALTFRSKRATK